jgi:hypothetical protein
MIAAGIGWDRFASGLPVVWHPTPDDSEAKAKEIGRSIRQHERGYVHLPSTGPALGAGRPESEWMIELLNGAQTLADPTPLLKFFTDEIYETGMLQFVRQGFGQTGARATAETQIDPFFLGVQELADYVRRERARQTIRRFVEVNFGQEAAETRTPLLTVSKIQARSITVVAQAISLLATAGFTFTDRGAQNDVRELMGFEQLPEVAEASGITLAQLDAALRAAGLDAASLAAVVNALPAGVGVARNTVRRARAAEGPRRDAGREREGVCARAGRRKLARGQPGAVRPRRRERRPERGVAGGVDRRSRPRPVPRRDAVRRRRLDRRRRDRHAPPPRLHPDHRRRHRRGRLVERRATRRRR